MQKNNWKNAGRKRKTKYISIFGDYDDTDLDKKVMTIPKIITQDIGYEMQFGFKHISDPKERQYLQSKKTDHEI